ncbi:ABC transporter permease [Arthrobacter ginkgonis]|uniref:ABC transporter permease n=1 Tax=Arthrobacter ginkgonis TaxID=1630594 RepID=A0ABP7C337_9MICC
MTATTLSRRRSAVPPGAAERRPEGRNRSRPWRQILALAVFALVWEVFARLSPGSGVPTFGATVAELGSQLGTSGFWAALGTTTGNALIGFALCLAIGVVAGLLIGLNDALVKSTSVVIDVFRSVPAVAFLPLTLLFFGATRPMVVTIVLISAVWPILIQSIYAVQQIDPSLRLVAKAFHLRKREIVRHIYLPSVLPFVFTGMRISATISLLLAISSEFLGGAPGLGMELNNALVIDRNDRVFALVIISGSLGMILNSLLKAAQGRALWWHPSERTASHD